MKIIDKKWSVISKERSELFGIAIISIVIFHYCEDVVNHGDTSSIIFQFADTYKHIIGSIGVEIFLFLSGIGLGFSFKHDSNLKRFYKKRAVRLLIPYLIWGGIFWGLRDLFIMDKGIVEFFRDYSLVSFWMDGNRNVWFIGFILIAYLLFPLLYRVFDTSEASRYRNMVVILFGYMIVVERIKIWFPQVYDNTEIALLRFPVFLLGTFWSFHTYQGRSFKISDFIFWGTGIMLKLITIAAWLMDIPMKKMFNGRIIVGWFSIALIVVVAVVFTRISNQSKVVRVLLWFGQYSLEIYLTHVTIRNIMNLIGLKTYQVHYYFICIGSALLFSIGLKHISAKAANKCLTIKESILFFIQKRFFKEI